MFKLPKNVLGHTGMLVVVQQHKFSAREGRHLHMGIQPYENSIKILFSPGKGELQLLPL